MKLIVEWRVAAAVTTSLFMRPMSPPDISRGHWLRSSYIMFKGLEEPQNKVSANTEIPPITTWIFSSDKETL